MRKRNLLKVASYVVAASLMLSNVGLVDQVQAAAKTKAEVIEIVADNVPVAMGKNVTLKAEVSPENASKSIVWQSENPKYVAVSKNGTITGKAAGLGKSVKIYAKSTDGSNLVTYTTVYVTKPTITLKISKKNLTVDEGMKTTIKTIVTPTKGVSKKLSFVSSNTKVVTVNQKGQVTGKKAGTSYITVKTIDGTKLSKKIKVTVKKRAEVNKRITSSDIKEGSYTLDGGTYDNVTIDKNVGGANIILKDVKVKNILNVTKGAGYSVIAQNSTINKLATVETKSVATLAQGENPSFTAGKGSTVSEITLTGDMKLVEEDGAAIKKVVVSPTASAKINVSLENFKGKLTVNQGKSAEVTIEAKSCGITLATLAGTVSIKDVSVVGATKTTIKTVNVNEKSTVLDIAAGVTVDKAVIKGEGSSIKGSGVIKEATVNANNIAVDTKGTKVTASPGTTGVTAGGNKVEPGKTVDTPSGSGGGGGGGGSVAPTPDFVKVNPEYNADNTKATYTVNQNIKNLRIAFKYSDDELVIKEISVAELLKEFNGTYPDELNKVVATRWNNLLKGAKTELLGYTITCNSDTADVKEFTVSSSNNSSVQDKLTGKYSVSKVGDVYTVSSIDGAKVKFVVTLNEKGFDVVGGRTTSGEEYIINFSKNNNKFNLVVESKLAERITIMVK